MRDGNGKIGQGKRILLVSQMFFPDDAATAKAMSDIAKSLVENGFSVEVLCQNRSYLDIDAKYAEDEWWEGVHIRRVPVPRLRKDGPFQRIFLLLLFTALVAHKLLKEDADLFLSVSNPPWLGYLVSQKAKKSGKPSVFILHDLYPDLLERLGRLSNRSLLYRFSRLVMEKIFTNSQKIVVLGRDVSSYINEQYEVPLEKIKLITNWGPSDRGESNQQACPATHAVFSGKTFWVLYSGNLGETAEFETLLAASQICQKRDPSIRFKILGSGKKKQWIEKKLFENKIDNVELHSFVPYPLYREMLHEADLFFVSLRPELKGISVPSKTYYYFSAGKPILAVVPEGSEIGLELLEDEVGIPLPYDGEALSEAILLLKNDQKHYSRLSEKCERTYKDKYQSNVVLPKYSALIREILN